MTVPDLPAFAERGRRLFPGLVGIEVTAFERGLAEGLLELKETHMAPNG